MNSTQMTGLVRPSLDDYANHLINGYLDTSPSLPPLPIEQVPALRDHLKNRFQTSTLPLSTLQEWVINFFSFADSTKIMEDLPLALNDDERGLMERVQKFSLIDLHRPRPITLDATAFRVTFIGQFLIGQSYHTEEFLERFYCMSLEEQLYIFKKQEGLADFFKLESKIIEDLESTGKSLRELLTNPSWVRGKNIEKILIDLSHLGPEALNQFFLAFHAEFPLILENLPLDDALQLLEQCELLLKYKEQPDLIAPALIVAFLKDPFNHQTNILNEQVANLIGRMNQHPSGIIYYETFFRDEYAYKVLMLTEWIRQNPTVPFKHPIPKLTQFLLRSFELYRRTQFRLDLLCIAPVDFPMVEFRQMDTYEMKLFLENGLFCAQILNLLLEQSPGTLKQILDLYANTQPNFLATKKTHQTRIMKYILGQSLHPMTDYRRIFRELDLSPSRYLSNFTIGKAQLGWDATIIPPVATFFEYLEPFEQFYLLLIQDTSKKSLYEFLQTNPHTKYDREVRILSLLEKFSANDLPELCAYFLPNQDTLEIFELVSYHSRFKKHISTFGGELLVSLYKNRKIDAEVYFKYAEAQSFDTFVELATLFEKDGDIPGVLKKTVSFNLENKTIEEHLLFLNNFSQDFYMGFFLNHLREKILGDGKFLLFVAQFLPQGLDLNRVLNLTPQNLIPYICLIMPKENRDLLLAPAFQQTLIKAYPLFPLSIQDWLEKEVNRWIVSPIVDMDTFRMKFLSIREQKEMEAKKKILDELQNEVFLKLSQSRHLKNLILMLEKIAAGSPLQAILKDHQTRSGPDLEKYRQLSIEWPTLDKSVCPFSSELLIDPVKIQGDKTLTLIEKSFLTSLIEKKGDDKGLASWPHDPSKKFGLLDLEPASETELKTIEDELRSFERSLEHFIQTHILEEVESRKTKKPREQD